MLPLLLVYDYVWIGFWLAFGLFGLDKLFHLCDKLCAHAFQAERHRLLCEPFARRITHNRKQLAKLLVQNGFKLISVFLRIAFGSKLAPDAMRDDVQGREPIALVLLF